MSNLTITDWAEEDRPRERLERLGAEALSNAELLAILIGSGTPKMSAVELMKVVLAACHNNLNTLGKMSIKDLENFKGIGPAKAITILAACELGKRRAREKAEIREDLGSATAVYNYMHPRMQDLDVEEFHILLMNQNFQLIKHVPLSHGGITETSMDVRRIMREVVMNNATILAVAHNHPSNNPHPSKADDIITKNLKAACEIMRIFFMDHIIISDGSYYSYHDRGKL